MPQDKPIGLGNAVKDAWSNPVKLLASILNNPDVQQNLGQLPSQAMDMASWAIPAGITNPGVGRKVLSDSLRTLLEGNKTANEVLTNQPMYATQVGELMKRARGQGLKTIVDRMPKSADVIDRSIAIPNKSVLLGPRAEPSAMPVYKSALSPAKLEPLAHELQHISPIPQEYATDLVNQFADNVFISAKSTAVRGFGNIIKDIYKRIPRSSVIAQEIEANASAWHEYKKAGVKTEEFPLTSIMDYMEDAVKKYGTPIERKMLYVIMKLSQK
jgi:hypothetical protein